MPRHLISESESSEGEESILPIPKKRHISRDPQLAVEMASPNTKNALAAIQTMHESHRQLLNEQLRNHNFYTTEGVLSTISGR